MGGNNLRIITTIDSMQQILVLGTSCGCVLFARCYFMGYDGNETLNVVI